MNFPLKDGVTDEQYSERKPIIRAVIIYIFHPIMFLKNAIIRAVTAHPARRSRAQRCLYGPLCQDTVASSTGYAVPCWWHAPL